MGTPQLTPAQLLKVLGESGPAKPNAGPQVSGRYVPPPSAAARSESARPTSYADRAKVESDKQDALVGAAKAKLDATKGKNSQFQATLAGLTAQEADYQKRFEEAQTFANGNGKSQIPREVWQKQADAMGWQLNDAKQKRAEAQKQYDDEQAQAQAEYDGVAKGADTAKGRIAQAVKNIGFHDSTNKAVQDADGEATKAYKAALAQHGDQDKAYQAYLSTKAQVNASNEAIKSDTAAGKYDVDPYDFIRGQHTNAEQASIEQQLDAGKGHPTIRNPGLAADPTAVAAPDALPDAPKAGKRDTLDSGYDDVYKTLGYKEPDYVPPPPPVATKELPVAQKTASSSFHGNTPASAPVAGPAADVSPPPPVTTSQPQLPPQTPPATNNLQQTSQSVAKTTPSQATSQTQSAPVPAVPTNPAGALPPQTSGAVSGQSSSTAASATPQATPAQVLNPTPFKDDTKKKDDPDVFDI